MEIGSERLAYWYFRLNGFFGNENFIVHRGINNSEHETDIDYLGVRFRHRRELYDDVSGEFLEDDIDSDLFKHCPDMNVNYIVLAEVKTSKPSINLSWLRDNTLRQVLMALGYFNERFIDIVVNALRSKGFCRLCSHYITFVAIGKSGDSDLVPFDIPVITWDHVKNFIYNRFKKWEKIKRDLNEWKNFPEIKDIRDLVGEYNDFDEFKNELNIVG
jgi:hypothetical protein